MAINKMHNHLLSKSRFMAGLQCHLRLWYQCYRRELIPDTDLATQYRFDTGHEVGRLATKLFPCGRLVESDHFHHDESAKITTQLIEDKSVPAIFEAGFFFDDVKIRVDVLQRTKGGKWNLIEVKSSTSAKEDHTYDAGIQYHVLNGAGIDVDKVSILHINNEYVYDGKKLNLNQFFTFSDITEEVIDIQSEIDELVTQYNEIIASNIEPDVAPGRQCKECEFFDHCTVDMPKHWIFYLPRISESRWEELTSLGIKDIKEIPDTVNLTPTQIKVRECVGSNTEYMGPNLESKLKEPKYPIHFFDIETINPGIPIYKGTNPYQMIPFQWSLHILEKNGKLGHHEFLHNENTDPRNDFIKTFLDLIQPKGTIIHYDSFETSRLNELANAFSKYVGPIREVINRFWDLLTVVRANYYHPDFMGSFSIKSVLPALVPELSYDDLEIQDGSMASVEYLRMIDPEISPKEKDDIHQALLKYCEQDTLSMVEVYKYLQKRCSKE